MNPALPGEARAPGAAEAERVRQEVAHPGWRLDAPTGMPAQRVAPAGLWYALTAAFPRFRLTVGIEPPHAGQVDGDLQLAGGPWPWRPTTPFALTIAAATGVTPLPAAAARRHRP
jgi:hypothetical protein